MDSTVRELARLSRQAKRAQSELDEIWKHIRETKRYNNLSDEVIEKARDEAGRLALIKRNIHNSRLAYQDNKMYYTSYLRAKKAQKVEKNTPHAIEKVNDEKRKQMKEGIADFIQKEIWSNEKSNYNYRTQKARKKAEELANRILNGEIEKYQFNNNHGAVPKKESTEYTRKEIIKKGYRDGYLNKEKIAEPEIWKYKPEKILEAQKEILEDLKHIIPQIKEKAREYGKNQISKRPIIYIEENVLREVNQRARERTTGPKGVEINGYFKFEKISEKQILIYEYHDDEGSEDTRTGTKSSEDYQDKLTERGVKENIIDFHSHPEFSKENEERYGKQDGLSRGDAGYLKDKREGIAIVALPWIKKPLIEPDIVWFAGLISGKKGSRLPSFEDKIPLHVVDSDHNNLDHKYGWPEIYNDRIELSLTNEKGPYWTHVQEETDHLGDISEI